MPEPLVVRRGSAVTDSRDRAGENSRVERLATKKGSEVGRMSIAFSTSTSTSGSLENEPQTPSPHGPFPPTIPEAADISELEASYVLIMSTWNKEFLQHLSATLPAPTTSRARRGTDAAEEVGARREFRRSIVEIGDAMGAAGEMAELEGDMPCGPNGEEDVGMQNRAMLGVAARAVPVDIARRVSGEQGKERRKSL